MSRDDLRLDGVNAQTDDRSKAFNPFKGLLYGYEAVTKQGNGISIGEVRDQ